MERAALADLFGATDGANWKKNEHWNTDAELSRWYGVGVNDHGSVVKLVLPGNDLKGMSLARSIECVSPRVNVPLHVAITSCTNTSPLMGGW